MVFCEVYDGQPFFFTKEIVKVLSTGIYTASLFYLIVQLLRKDDLRDLGMRVSDL